MLLLDGGRPTPLYTWKLKGDYVVSLQLFLGSGKSAGPEGVLCLTAKGEMLLLSVATTTGDKASSTPGVKVSNARHHPRVVLCT